MRTPYVALVSSDWNECLAPCGPFDVVGFHFPELAPRVEAIFRSYTTNAIPLGSAIDEVARLLPEPIGMERMDAYLRSAFATYRGVAELMAMCREQGILFMINTTGLRGYFQRAVALRLLPPPAALSAHPLIAFEEGPGAGPFYPLLEIADKARNTAAAAAHFKIPPEKIILMGDSGGDGPHFQWGVRVGARLIGCMVKASLGDYCRRAGIVLHHRFGPVYAAGEPKDPRREAGCDFRDLFETIASALA
ncbi:MAG: hypothetical protein HY911_12305 [Desulfobacterales bacterium]|nr:hypothetical protein [Desulfobacterales bacterium]